MSCDDVYQWGVKISAWCEDFCYESEQAKLQVLVSAENQPFDMQVTDEGLEAVLVATCIAYR